LTALVRALVRVPTPPGPRLSARQPQAPFTPTVTDQERAADGRPEIPKNRALISGFDRRVRTKVRAALSHHNDEGVTRCLPGRARYHPQAADRGPVNTLADPGDQAWGARVKPEVAALLLAQGPASHSLAAGLLASANTAVAWRVG
jgi:hypothetical protein